MGKDPAFLFYSKDWLEGTADMLPKEKGVYIDLLCYQHQRGSIPSDTKLLARMVGLAEPEFRKLWSAISSKFRPDNQSSGLVNPRLNQATSDRKERGRINKINGIFGVLCRKSGLTDLQIAKIKKGFKHSEFAETPSEGLTERLTEWFTKHSATPSPTPLPPLGNANGNGNNIKKESKKFLPPSKDDMIAYFVQNGYRAEIGAKAWEGYNSAEWMDSHGKPVLNWKQKSQHVWFRDEHKMPQNSATETLEQRMARLRLEDKGR